MQLLYFLLWNIDKKYQPLKALHHYHNYYRHCHPYLQQPHPGDQQQEERADFRKISWSEFTLNDNNLHSHHTLFAPKLAFIIQNLAAKSSGRFRWWSPRVARAVLKKKVKKVADSSRIEICGREGQPCNSLFRTTTRSQKKYCCKALQQQAEERPLLSESRVSLWSCQRGPAGRTRIWR